MEVQAIVGFLEHLPGGPRRVVEFQTHANTLGTLAGKNIGAFDNLLTVRNYLHLLTISTARPEDSG
jgi:hypothetical protein